MNILFLTIGRFDTVKARGIYPDLIRHLRDQGHNVYISCSYEKRLGKPTEFIQEDGVNFLHVKIGNITKCGMIEKGISTLRIEGQYKRAIKRYFKGVKFDLVLYSTPPITFAKVVKYIKKRDNAKTYLLLKDIFPQNAVDIGVLSKSGVKGILYKFFRRKEKNLYAFSDKIGCMSPANCRYVLDNNPEVSKEKVEVCPNSVEYTDMRVDEQTAISIREKYGIPLDKKVFVYGGNLGKPQGIPFIIECLKAQNNKDAFFLIVGDGTEFGKLQQFIDEEKPENVKLMKRLPKEDYDKMVAACDVGMIFLDYRFTIPNFPSRLLAYMQAGLPVFACTDINTDVGEILAQGDFGWWCPSNDTVAFAEKINEILQSDLTVKKENAVKYLKENYLVSNAYQKIINDFGNEE